MPELFNNLRLDAWYKLLIYIGGVSLFFSVFWNAKGITNGQLQLVSAGIFLIGLGESKNWKVANFVEPANAYTGPAKNVSVPIRHPDVLGLGMDIFGGALAALGVIKIVLCNL